MFPESIANIAAQEDVDVIGLSSLTGGHRHQFVKVIEMLKTRQMDNVLVIGGGIVPPDDISFLKEKGVKAVFGPGTQIRDVADFIRQNVKQ